ncbi:MAG: hypothetical protein ACI8PP_001862 [Candidatus Pseudothioglobus sp.]|jgi:hypothetical protein
MKEVYGGYLPTLRSARNRQKVTGMKKVLKQAANVGMPYALVLAMASYRLLGHAAYSYLTGSRSTATQLAGRR